MTISIRNLYYLFLYAWARFPGGAIGEVGIDKSPDLPSLFAKLLSAGAHVGSLGAGSIGDTRRSQMS